MAIREKVIEDYLVAQVKKAGGRAYKFTSSAYRSIPDRMCVFPHGVLIFVEVKAPGRKVTKRQAQEIDYLRLLKQKVVVIDSRPKVDVLIKWYYNKIRRMENGGDETARPRPKPIALSLPFRRKV